VIPLILASIFTATPMGPGQVPHFMRTCDRIRIHDPKTGTNWILCINGVYQFPKNGRPQDRSLPQHKQQLI